jgi:Cu(I)-responsive transcriptional regulator
MNQLLTIGKLARETDVSVDSIRFYERRGLLGRPLRTASNYRVYNMSTASRLRFIKRAQRLGFSLDEIHDLLNLHGDASASKAQVKLKTQDKILDVQEKLSDLRKILAALKKLDASCDGHGPASECPILHALAGDDSSDCQR